MVEAIKIQKNKTDILKEIRGRSNSFSRETLDLNNIDPADVIPDDTNSNGGINVSDPRLLDLNNIDPADVIPADISGHTINEVPLTDYLKFKFNKNMARLVQTTYDNEFMQGRISLEEAQTRGNLAYLEQLGKEDKLEEIAFSEDHVKNVLGEAAGVLPSMLGSIREGLKTGLLFGGAFAAISTVTGPAVFVAAPAAFAIGMSTGMVTGIIKFAIEQEGASLFRGLVEKGISEKTARPLALGAGLGIGVMDAYGLKLVTAPFKRAFSGIIKDKISQGALLEGLKNYGKTTALEVGVEDLQEGVSIATELMAGIIENNPNAIPDVDSIMDRIIQTTIQSTKAFGVITAPGAVLTSLTPQQRAEIVKEAVKSEGVLEKKSEEKKGETKTKDTEVEKGKKVETKAKDSDRVKTIRKTIKTKEKITPKLPKHLSGSKPRFGFGQKGLFSINFASDIDKALFIIDQDKPSKSNQQFLDFLKPFFPTLSEEQLQGKGKAVKNQIKSMIAADETDGQVVSLPETIFAKEGKTLTREVEREFFVEQTNVGFDFDTNKDIIEEKVLGPVPIAEEESAKQKKEAKKEKLIEDQKAIAEDAKTLIPDEDVFDRGVGEIERGANTSEKAKGIIGPAVQFAKKKFITLTPMNVVFDLMSKTKAAGKGAVFQILKKPIDLAHNKYIAQRNSIMKPIRDLLVNIKLNNSNLESIAVWATLQQDGGRQKLEAASPEKGKFTAEKLDDFLETGLTEDEQTLLSAMRAHFEKLKPQLRQVLNDVYGKKFKEVEDFFPFMADFEAMEDMSIEDMFGPDAPLVGLLDKTNRKGGEGVNTKPFKERVGGSNKIKLNALEVFARHIDISTYLINMGETISDAQNLAKTKSFKQSVGSFGSEVVDAWLKMMQKKGGLDSKRIRALDILRENAGMAILGYKLSSAIIQPTALLDAAAIIGGQATFRGAYNVLTNPKWMTFVKNNFIEVENRTGDDASFKNIAENDINPTIITRVKKNAFWALKTLDGITAAAAAAGAYEKFVLEKGGVVDFSNPDTDAIIAAEEVVNRSQGSGLVKDAPAAIAQGRFFGNQSLDKAFFQFQTFALGRFSLITSALSQQESIFKPTTHSLNVAVYLTLAAIAASSARVAVDEFVSALTPGDDEEKDILDNVVGKIVREIYTSPPIVPNVLSLMFFNSTSIPSFEMVKQSGKRLGLAVNSDKHKLLNASRGVIALAGISGKLPGAAQIDQIVEAVFTDKKKTTKGQVGSFR